MSITQRRPAVRMRRERTRSQRYYQVCAELEHMHRMHPEEGCYEAYPKLREANEKLIKFAESVCDFFAAEAPVCVRIAAGFRIQGNADFLRNVAKKKTISLKEDMRYSSKQCISVRSHRNNPNSLCNPVVRSDDGVLYYRLPLKSARKSLSIFLTRYSNRIIRNCLSILSNPR